MAKLMPMLFGLALALASAPAFADGVPAASLQQPANLMPWPAHVQRHEGHLALTQQFDVQATGHPGQRVYDAATRLLQHLQQRSGIAFNQHLVTADDGFPCHQPAMRPSLQRASREGE